MTQKAHTARSNDRQTDDVLAEAGLALARPLSADRVLTEVVAQLRRAMRSDAAVIALAEPGDSASFTVVHQSGFDGTATELASRFDAIWSGAARSASAVVDDSEHGLALTAPMRVEQRLVGVLMVILDKPEPGAAVHTLTRLLDGIAAHAAAALERAAAVRLLEHKRRVATVDEVSVGLAHELRNRLFGISSAAQLLRFRVTEDPAVEKNVGRILREVERMNNTVNALLEFGQPVPAKLAAGDPDVVWDAVLDQQQGRFESKALKLVRRRATPAVSCPIDASQLATAFTHLVVNATDAAPEGTDLSLESTALPGGGWRCKLANGGAPLGDEARRRAFDLFYTTKPAGTGMGLPLCQRIIGDHSGTLTLESAPETGTVAAVTIPGHTA